MKKTKYISLMKAIIEQIDLPDDAVIVDLGCRDATFLLGFQEILQDLKSCNHFSKIRNTIASLHLSFVVYLNL
jgi:hypothetical protein